MTAGGSAHLGTAPRAARGSGALRWTARRLPGVDERLRTDLVASADQLAERSGRLDAALEVASLLGFALRAASRRGARDDRHELVRQGVRVGALVLALVGALAAWAAVWTAGQAGQDPGTATGLLPAGVPAALAAAALATLLAAAVAGGLRTGAVVLAAVQVGVVALAVVPAPAGTGDAPLALPLVVLGAVVLGHRYDARGCPAGAALAAAAIALSGMAAGLAPNGTVTAVTVAGLAVPAVLLAVGWFDPRYAVAATVVWLWRLVAVDLGELAGAVDALADELTFRLLLARWLAMGLGVVLAWQVSNAAIRRCLTVFRDG
jgi:hypothetical protein